MPYQDQVNTLPLHCHLTIMNVVRRLARHWTVQNFGPGFTNECPLSVVACPLSSPHDQNTEIKIIDTTRQNKLLCNSNYYMFISCHIYLKLTHVLFNMQNLMLHNLQKFLRLQFSQSCNFQMSVQLNCQSLYNLLRHSSRPHKVQENLLSCH